jgi:hypothetical protein
VGAGGEKFAQARRRKWDGIGPRHAGQLETLRAGGCDQLGFERLGI